ncbi:MAG: hypothetical protein C4345_11340, partial [Chloroflexota bacterium]
MIAYLTRRSLRMLVILVFASIAVFYSLRFAPGDPSGVTLNPLTREEVREAYRRQLGLDKPVYTQYFVYISNLVQGKLGVSLVNGAEIWELFKDYGKNSLILGLAAIITSHLIGIPLGIIAAARRNSLIDQFVTLLSILGMGIPNFWLALLLIFLFTSKLHWLA